MRLLLLLGMGCAALAAPPVLRTEYRAGAVRALLFHQADGSAVTEESPALPGEPVFVLADGASGDVAAMIDGKLADAIESDGVVRFTIPESVGGSFVEVAVMASGERSNTATTTVRGAADPAQLNAGEVEGIVQRAAGAIDDARMAIAVVDRAGRPLAVYRKPDASDRDVEVALSLARTGAFFSHNQAPLSSRTIRTLSRENFPEAPNQPAAALFGIELTNRGCGFNAPFLPGKDLPPARNLADGGPGLGVTTIPGGLPLYKGGLMVGGVGVAGIDANAAEFAAVASVAGTPFFVPLPLPPPGAVFVDGIRLPYVEQTTRPAGTRAASAPVGSYAISPRDGAAAPDGYLIGPRAGVGFSVSDVEGIIQRALETANRTRAVIRLPLGSRTRMAMAVTDLTGTVLALYRMPDSTVFSADVAVAKARNVTYFSSAQVAPNDLPGVPPGTAVTNRSIGFGAQSYFPSGITDSTPGPFRELFLYDQANPCTQGRQPKNPNQNGIVFFPGSAPLYRGGSLIGGLGVSGDGVEQDDWVTSKGVVGFEAPASVRVDQVIIRGVRIPYWKFPRNPEQ